MSGLSLSILIIASAFEVGGDALIRKWLHGAVYFLLLGALLLTAYGTLINLAPMNFNRMMGVYIVLFFVASQLAGYWFFQEKMTLPLLVGGGFIVAGGMIIQFWTRA